MKNPKSDKKSQEDTTNPNPQTPWIKNAKEFTTSLQLRLELTLPPEPKHESPIERAKQLLSKQLIDEQLQNTWNIPQDSTSEHCKESPLQRAKRILKLNSEETCESSPELHPKWRGWIDLEVPTSKETIILSPPSPQDHQLPLREFGHQLNHNYLNPFGDNCEEPNSEDEDQKQINILEPYETQEINKSQKQHLTFKDRSIHRAGLLSLSGFKEDRDLAKKLHSCSQRVYQFQNGESSTWRCKNRFCHTCQNLKRNKLTKIFEQNLIMNSYTPSNYYFVTLTLPMLTLRKEASEHIKLLNRNFGKLARRKLWRESVDGYIKVIEFTQKGEFINPHIHLLIAGNSSFGSNRLFQRKTDKQGKPYFQLGYVWGNYFKELRSQSYTYVDVKTIKPRRERTEKEKADLNWIPVHQITPNELSTDILGYMLKPEKRDPNPSIDDYATEQTSELLYNLKNSRLISTSGSLLGFLSAPKRRKLTEEERQAITDKFRTENIKGRYEYNINSKRYTKTDQFSFASFGLLQLKTLYSRKRNKQKCEHSNSNLLSDTCYQFPKDPLRAAHHVTFEKDE